MAFYGATYCAEILGILNERIIRGFPESFTRWGPTKVLDGACSKVDPAFSMLHSSLCEKLAPQSVITEHEFLEKTYLLDL